MSEEVRRFTETREVEYWSCASPDCGTKHKTEDAASRCQLHRSWITRAERVESKDYGRKMAVVVLHARGHSFAKIGEAFGISGSRVQQIHNTTKSRLNVWIRKFDEWLTDAEVS